MKTPDWILEGKEPPKKKKAGKTFKIRECPKCNSKDVEVVLGGAEGKGSQGWKCHKCGWTGEYVKEEELTEEGFMKYLDEKGEKVA